MVIAARLPDSAAASPISVAKKTTLPVGSVASIDERIGLTISRPNTAGATDFHAWSGLSAWRTTNRWSSTVTRHSVISSATVATTNAIAVGPSPRSPPWAIHIAATVAVSTIDPNGIRHTSGPSARRAPRAIAVAHVTAATLVRTVPHTRPSLARSIVQVSSRSIATTSATEAAAHSVYTPTTT